ncbi:CBS domain-containing protein [Halobacterium zhouii]|uniref:CBS domain-containing protein n=1 Tax=Halobacterium zhouii TaxID=2902624 RepID=UPI001E2C9070|nr:CBS domain-containing protein [Halobacterium zhouii]
MTRLALRDVMSREYVGVSESDGLLDAVELMRTEDTSSAVVLRGNTPVGVVTSEAVLDLLVDGGDPTASPVEAAMENTPPALSPAASVAEAAELMGRTGDGRVLVADDDGIHGVVEAHDLTSAVTQRDGPAAEAGPGGTATPPSADASGGTATDEYSAQSICEACGSLARELANVNGQLLCSDCRSV